MVGAVKASDSRESEGGRIVLESRGGWTQDPVPQLFQIQLPGRTAGLCLLLGHPPGGLSNQSLFSFSHPRQMANRQHAAGLHTPSDALPGRTLAPPRPFRVSHPRLPEPSRT